MMGHLKINFINIFYKITFNKLNLDHIVQDKLKLFLQYVLDDG